MAAAAEDILLAAMQLDKIIQPVKITLYHFKDQVIQQLTDFPGITADVGPIHALSGRAAELLQEMSNGLGSLQQQVNSLKNFGKISPTLILTVDTVSNALESWISKSCEILHTFSVVSSCYFDLLEDFSEKITLLERMEAVLVPHNQAERVFIAKYLSVGVNDGCSVM